MLFTASGRGAQPILWGHVMAMQGGGLRGERSQLESFKNPRLIFKPGFVVRSPGTVCLLLIVL